MSDKQINFEMVDGEVPTPLIKQRASLVLGNAVDEDLKNYLTGFKAPILMSQGKSKVREIKKARKKEIDTETLIRRFNLKRFDEVIKGLKA